MMRRGALIFAALMVGLLLGAPTVRAQTTQGDDYTATTATTGGTTTGGPTTGGTTTGSIAGDTAGAADGLTVEGPLARTGSNSTLPLIRFGFGLLAAGGMAILVSRRRRTSVTADA